MLWEHGCPAWRYCDSSGLVFWASIVFVTASYCCVSRRTYHIPIFLFLVPLIIYCPFYWTAISCLSSVMLHQLSHKTPNDISGAVFIYGKMWICLASLIRPGCWSVAMCDESIVLPSGSLAVMSFEIMTGSNVLVACFSGWIFAPGSATAGVFLLVEFGGITIQYIKLILRLLI